jgi:hypothetical protein
MRGAEAGSPHGGSHNSKVAVIGNSKNGLPIILDGTAVPTTAKAGPRG